MPTTVLPTPSGTRARLRVLVAMTTVVLGVALPPAGAHAAAPAAITSFSENLSPTQSRVVGEIDPGGEATTVRALYDTADSDFCSVGTGGAPSATAPEPVAGDAGPTVVEAPLDGLAPGTTYCVVLEAVNAGAPGGVRSSPPEIFRAGAPDTSESAAAGATPTTGRLAVDVWPAGQVTTVAFRWAPAASDFCTSDGTVSGGETAVAPQTVGPVNEWTPVTAEVSGLTPGQAYCYVSSAENASIAGSPVVDFWTFETPTSVAVTRVTTGTAADVGATRATLTAAVDGGGLATTVAFEYALASSAWCTSGGLVGTADHETHEQLLDGGAGPVSTVVTELAPQTAYCYRALARNTEGATPGATVAFTTGAIPGVVPPTPVPAAAFADPPQTVVPRLGRIYLNARDAGRRIERVRGAVTVGVTNTRLTVEVLTRGALRGVRGSAQRRVRIGRLTRTVRAPGVVGFSVRLSSAARRALRAKRTARVFVRLTVGTGATAATRTLAVTLHRTPGRPAACGSAVARRAGSAACPR